jgi:hypothetical protein
MKVVPLMLGLGLIQQAAAIVIQLEAILLPENVVPLEGPSPAGASDASGRGAFFLDLTPGAPTMTYTLTFDGLSMTDDITAVHLHFGHEPPPLTIFSPDPTVGRHVGAAGINGPHLLNIFGIPREDDADLIVDFANSTLSGIYDNGDENFGPDGIRDPGDSVAISEAIDAILLNETYIQVHTRAFPGGEIRGQVKAVPEPTTSTITVLALLGACLHRSRLKEDSCP